MSLTSYVRLRHDGLQWFAQAAKDPRNKWFLVTYHESRGWECRCRYFVRKRKPCEHTTAVEQVYLKVPKHPVSWGEGKTALVGKVEQEG